MAPASAVIAEDEISLANLAVTEPLDEGVIIPQIVATLPVAKELALLAAGMSYAPAELTVVVVAVRVYSLR